MDPIGVALGTAALLSTVLDVFRLVTSFRSYVEASGILFRQLELEREVLQRWTKEVGLHPLSEVSSTQCAIPTELLPLVHTSVASIGSLLARATSIRAAKGMSEAGVHDLRLVYDTLRSEIVNSQKQSRLSRSLARLGWAIGEEDQLKDLISTIHSYNTSLHNLIPKPLQVSLDGSLMQIILAERDENRLLEIQQASSHWRKALSVAASVTVLQQRRPSAAPPSSNQLLIPRSKLSSVGSDLSRHFTQYASGTDKVDVLIEWRAYRIPRNSGQKPYYLNTYLDLARLLHASQSLPAYRTLDCLGIIDDVEFQPHPRIGLVYRVPSITLSFSLGNSVRAHTLYDQINGKEFARPRLEQRFELARSLATGLHRLFVSRWYHKNLNSKNILFFARGNSTDDKSLVPNSEYIHSYEITVKPEVDEFSDRYRHPQCTNPATRQTIPFTRRFDIYSLGVILVELGRWETVDLMHRDFTTQRMKGARKGQAPVPPPGLESFQKYLRTRCVESLGFRMGTIYTNAVRFCFEDASVEVRESELDADVEEVLVSRFNKEVVAELVRCTA